LQASVDVSDVAFDAGGAASTTDAVLAGASVGVCASLAGAASEVGGAEAAGAVSPAAAALGELSLEPGASVADVVVGGSEAGEPVSPAAVGFGKTSLEAGVPADCGAWLKLSKRAMICGCNLEQLNSSWKRKASFIEGLA
jgi:hypothetical protein